MNLFSRIMVLFVAVIMLTIMIVNNSHVSDWAESRTPQDIEHIRSMRLEMQNVGPGDILVLRKGMYRLVTGVTREKFFYVSYDSSGFRPMEVGGDNDYFAYETVKIVKNGSPEYRKYAEMYVLSFMRR